ncbi:MAG: ABC transporter ATP-binding protein [Calditerrivibrio sp.]|nr:ABC transporter ATP-binding protein [Calditerrivibrio sp.]
MLSLKNITISNKNFQINNLNLNIKSQTIHCLLGPTGCGKTTLLEAILGLRRLEKGEIIRDNIRIDMLPVHKRGFSYVPQDLALFPHLTVRENILYSVKYTSIDNTKKGISHSDEITDQLGIVHLMDRKVAHLSGGEKQRVALARALVSGNEYILLDEPFSALHEGLKRDLWFLMKDIQKKYKNTFIMITHNLEEAFFLGDDISVMIDGSIKQSGAKEEIYKTPKSKLVAEFLGIKNIFKAEKVSENLLYVEELGTTITVSPEVTERYYNTPEIHIGIRSEHVMILREDLRKKDQENMLDGIIYRIYCKTDSHTVVFNPHTGSKLIEIEVPAYAFSKLSLSEGQNIKICLTKENIFPIL